MHERITFSLKNRDKLAEAVVGLKSGDKVKMTVTATVAEVTEDSVDAMVDDIDNLAASNSPAPVENSETTPADVVYPSA
jgi:hypothetical protein